MTLINYPDFDDYQHQALQTLMKGNKEHLAFGLLAEAGEIATIFQKQARQDPRYYQEDLFGMDLTEEARKLLFKELGDVMWYTACLADYFGMPLSAIVAANLEKLQKRKEEGLIQGDGDNR